MCWIYGFELMCVVVMGCVMLEGLVVGGVVGVVKYMLGYGCVVVDMYYYLLIVIVIDVEFEVDIELFYMLN